MTAELSRLFVEAGLLQFGRFYDGANGEMRPFRLSLEYLPAYPEVLGQVAAAAESRLDGLNVQRLVASADAVPFGVALSLRTGISLVYSQDSGREAVYDLAGAYNIGHAAALLTNTLEDGERLAPFIASARRVGLEIHTLAAVIDTACNLALPGISVEPLLRLPEVVQGLEAARQLPPGQCRAVLDWIRHRQRD